MILSHARTFALFSMLLGCWALISTFYSEPIRLRANVDFPAFYIAGQIINEGGDPYNRSRQEELYQQMAPGKVEDNRRLFAYTPFFALLFVPLAEVSYFLSFAIWTTLSVGLFVAGFLLVAREIPSRHKYDALIMAFSFLPFYAWCLGMGQTSAFGFFFLALAIYFEKSRRLVLSGFALALLLYKPPLLVLLIPMLLITQRWKTLAGLSCGAIVLGLISLAVVRGDPSSYLAMLRHFAELKATGSHVTALEIDAFSFFYSLVGLQWANLLFVGLVVLALPLLFTAWRKNSDQAWAIAISWTLILNYYVLLYDATLAIVAVVLSWKLCKNKLLQFLLVALFIAPWLQTYLAQRFDLQPVTLALFALSGYLLFRVQRVINQVGLSAGIPNQPDEDVYSIWSRAQRNRNTSGEFVRTMPR